jgi:hypothetical protein
MIIKTSMEQTWCMDIERGATFSLMLNYCSERSPGSSWLHSFSFFAFPGGARTVAF